MKSKFKCRACGNEQAMSPEADLDFETCEDCGECGEWLMIRAKAGAVAPIERELLPAKIEKMAAKDIFADEQIKEVVVWAKKEAGKHVPDVTTKAGRDAIASNSRMVSSTKVVLEKIAAARKQEIKRESESEISIIQTGLKYMVSELEALRDEKRKPLTDWEKAEKARKAAELLAEQIALDHDAALAEDDLFNREKAATEKEATLAKEEEKRVAKAAEEKRLADEKATKAKAEKEAKAREKELKANAKKDADAKAAKKIADAKEAEEKAKREKVEAEEKAAREKKEAGERAEREKVEAVAAAKKKAAEEAKQKEKDRLAKIEEKRLADEKRAANKEHRASIISAVEDELVGMAGLTKGQAKDVIESVLDGAIPHMTINF